MTEIDSLESLASELGAALLARQWLLVTAESCTGGWIAEAVTTIAGSSAWYERGFVTYSDEAKQAMLDVPGTIIAAHGAVSDETAAAMARGALAHSRAHIAVSVTGVAGPTGGSAAKPVGTVWFGFACRGQELATHHQLFVGDRTSIRRQAVAFALRRLVQIAGA